MILSNRQASGSLARHRNHPLRRLSRQVLCLALPVIAMLSCTSLALADDCTGAARQVFESEYPDLFDDGAIVDGSRTFADAERRSLAEMSQCARCPQVPFGYINDKWVAFKAMYRDGDCLVYFRSGKRSWDGLFGREGYALFRDDGIIAVFITLLN